MSKKILGKLDFVQVIAWGPNDVCVVIGGEDGPDASIHIDHQSATELMVGLSNAMDDNDDALAATEYDSDEEDTADDLTSDLDPEDA